MIEVSKIPQYIVLKPTDKEGGHNLVQVMSSPRIKESRKKITKDGGVIDERDIHTLNNIIKEYKFKCKTDGSFREFVKEMQQNSKVKDDAVCFKVGVIFTKIIGKNIPVKDIQKATRFFVVAAVNTPKYKTGKWDGYINLYKQRPQTFPTGLLSVVEKIFDKAGIPYTVEYDYDRRPQRQFDWDVDWDKIIPDPDQVEAIEAAIKYGRGIVKAPTGWGKTAVFAKGLIASLGVPTLFVANKKQLLDDAADDFTNGITGATCLAIKDGMFGSVKMGPETTAKDVIGALDAPIIVATIQSLDARLKDDRTSAELLEFLSNKVKLVILDETQFYGSAVFDQVFEQIHAPYRIFLSATPRRTDGATIKLTAGSGPCIFSTTAEEQIAKGRLCELDITYNTFDHGLFNEGDTNIIYNDAYRGCILENEKRNQKMIVDPAIEMIKEGRHVLILIQYIEHGHILKQMLMASGVDPENIRFIWGETPNKIRQSAISEFRKGDFQVMIGSTIFDAGVNIPVISGVVLGGAGNSDITLIQRIGRGARNCEYEDIIGYLPEFMKDAHGQKVTKIYDVMDANVKFFAKQSRNRHRNACDEFGKDRVHIRGRSEIPASKMYEGVVSNMDAAKAKFDMMMDMKD